MSPFWPLALLVLLLLVLSWIIGRFDSTRGATINLLAGLAARLATVAVMAYSTAEALQRGGWFLALAALFALIGVGAVVTGVTIGGALWMVVTRRATD